MLGGGGLFSGLLLGHGGVSPPPPAAPRGALPPPPFLSDGVSPSQAGGGAPAAGVEREPGSFRDPASTVFYLDGRVLRGLDERAAAEWRALQATGFFPRLLE